MKKKLLVFSVLVAAVASAIGVAQSSDLRTEVDALRAAVYQRGQFLPIYERQEIAAKMAEIRNYIMGNQPPPPPPPSQGYFCNAACATSDRVTPDLRYSAGAEARFEIAAKDAARQILRQKWNCSYGVVDAECSPVNYREHKCIASCSDNVGDVQLQYAKLGSSGRSEAEARSEARELVRQNWNCSYGMTDYECDSSSVPHYCVAACANGDRKSPNLGYSKGAEGRSLLEAMSNAIDEVRNSWNCGNGIVISECSR